MENWENKTIAEKLNSLDLPAGYAPNLLSKWEIIEAGLPKQKKVINPLLIWTLAAAILLGVVFTFTTFFLKNNKKIGLQLSANQMPIKAIKTILSKPILNQINVAQKIDNQNKKTTPIIDNKNLLVKEEIKRQLIKTPVLILDDSKNIDTTSNLISVAKLPILTLQKTEIIKPAKSKIFQKDFVDEVLTMDKSKLAPSQSANFKIQINTNSSEENGQSSPALQWKKSF